MRRSFLTGLSGIVAEMLYAALFLAIGLLIAWICWMASI
jgi:hypothetical protein